jgi:hypothetical protein
VDDAGLADNNFTPLFKTGNHAQFIGNFTDLNPGATEADFNVAPGSIVVHYTPCGGAPQTVAGFVQKAVNGSFNVFANFNPGPPGTGPSICIHDVSYKATDEGGSTLGPNTPQCASTPFCPITTNFSDAGLSPKLIEGNQSQFVGQVNDAIANDTVSGTVTYRRTPLSSLGRRRGDSEPVSRLPPRARHAARSVYGPGHDRSGQLVHRDG